MQQSIPQYLYRGDSDPVNKRKLKGLFSSELLLTNLCSGGNGREIFSLPLNQSISRHVGVGWDKSHFLSFSSDEATAMRYGCNYRIYDDVYDYTEPWDFAIFTFDSTRLIQNTTTQLQRGVYSAKFEPANNEFLPIYSIILIDVVEHLRNITSSQAKIAMHNAERDKEWLILPTAPFGSQGEFTAKLDTACISEKRTFRWE